MFGLFELRVTTSFGSAPFSSAATTASGIARKTRRASTALQPFLWQEATTSTDATRFCEVELTRPDSTRTRRSPRMAAVRLVEREESEFVRDAGSLALLLPARDVVAMGRSGSD
jgi:hypothetical protein